MAEFSANAYQTVAPGQNVILTSSFLAQFERRYMLHRDDTPGVLLRGFTPYREMGCCCLRDDYSEYFALFGANVNIPEGGTVGQIALALTVNGEVMPLSTMIATPAAAEDFTSVSTQLLIPIPRWCCQSVAVENIGDTEIGVQNANLTILLPSLR